MIYYFFASAPLHAINISEFIKEKKISNYKIFINITNINYIDRQLLNTIKFLKLRNINKLYWSKFKILKLIQTQNFINSIKSQFNNKITFVISDFRDFLFHQIRMYFNNSNFILIDDGNIIFNIYKTYISKNIYFPFNQYNKFYISILKYIFPNTYKNLFNSKILIFSFYKNFFRDKIIVKNKLKFIKKGLNCKSIQKNNSIVFILGTKLYERGVLSLDQEIKILDKIKLYWGKKGKKLVYISKRTTSDEKLKEIRKKLSIDYIKFNLPIEIALSAEYKKIPFAVCSFGSTANFTLKKIYNLSSYVFISKEIKNKIYKNNSNYLIFNKYSKIIKI